jgi:hypothetical protein
MVPRLAAGRKDRAHTSHITHHGIQDPDPVGHSGAEWPRACPKQSQTADSEARDTREPRGALASHAAVEPLHDAVEPLYFRLECTN